MSKQIKYPYLPEGREIKYVDMDNKFMQAAFYAAKNMSTDLNYPTGAAIVLNNEIIGTGGNHGKIKNQWFLNKHKAGLCVRKLLKVESGKGYWMCPGCIQPSGHAERHALKDAKSNHKDIKGFDLYLWGHWWPCGDCWHAAIVEGVKNVYLLKDSETLLNKRDYKNHHVGDFDFFEKMIEK